MNTTFILGRKQVGVGDNFWIIIPFLSTIFLPFFGLFFPGFSAARLAENRRLAPVPYSLTAFSAPDSPPEERVGMFFKNIHLLPGQVKAYVNDHFGFRSILIDAAGRVNLLVGCSPSSKVAIGKSDTGFRDDPGSPWLYYLGESTLEHFRAIDLFSDSDLDRWDDFLNRRSQACEEIGSKYFVLIAPNKASIYPEFVPEKYTRCSAISRTDQLIDSLRKSRTIGVLEVQEGLLSTKKREPDARLYHRVDTHWNCLGGYVGYRCIIEGTRLSPKSGNEELPDFQLLKSTDDESDLLRMLGVKDFYTDLTPEINLQHPPGDKVITQRDVPKKKLLMFHDSFGTELKRFLVSDFDCIFVCGAFSSDIVCEVQPDFVLSVFVERKLMHDFPPSKLP